MKRLPGSVPMYIELHPIGTIRSPFIKEVPGDIDMDQVECRIVIDPAFKDGLLKLDAFSHIYILFYFHKVNKKPQMIVKPPRAGGISVGVFASRSPVRPNGIGLGIVRLKHIEGNEIYTSGFDVLDGTPILDIKPYIGSKDSKAEANDGWLEDLNRK
ncbi:MAG: tRNA (N6-threonylcarbamoyladenosine(37)-N6)-methyltransferase TrmO [Spirochaetota bacterium]